MNNLDLLDELLMQLERAYVDEGDTSLIDRLCREYPEHAGELCEFFDAMLLHEEYAGPPLLAEVEIQELLAEVRKKEHWVTFLRAQTGKDVDEIASGLTRASMEYLYLVSRLPQLVPSAVKFRLAGEIEKNFGVSRRATLQHLVLNPDLTQAASRKEAFANPPTTFEELLKLSGLTKKDREYWLKIGEEE